MTNFQPKDLIAVMILLIFAAMKIKGMNGGLDSLIALIIGYYFGHRKAGIDNGK